MCPQVVALTWGQLLALIFMATLPVGALAFYIARMTQTVNGGERYLFPRPGLPDPPVGKRRFTDRV